MPTTILVPCPSRRYQHGGTALKHVTFRLALVAFLLSSSIAVALAVPDDEAPRRITTIAGLNNIQQIGSTQNIQDANGNAIVANANPYKVIVVPERTGKLAKGTVLVSNIG